MNWDSFEAVSKAFANGDFVIIHDEHREVEGDFFLLGEYVTPEKINFLFQESKGMICVALSAEVCDQIQLPLMVSGVDNKSEHGTNFCTLVDASSGITTGVSASDRAMTIKKLSSPSATISDFVLPGHTAPLRAQDPSKRWGHTEGAVTLAQFVGAYPSVVICEILNQHGEKATELELKALCAKYSIKGMSLEALKLELLGE